MASSTNNDDPNKSSTQSVGILDFNRINSASSNQPPSEYKLPIFHFHSYGSDDRTVARSSRPVAPGATDFPQGIFYIKSALSGKVLDVPGGSRKPDTRIVLWTQKHGQDRDNQLWFTIDNFIMNVGSRLCLDIRGSLTTDDLEQFAETRIIQYTRKSRVDAHNQRFGLSPEGYIYCLAHPNLVFDVRGHNESDGATLIIYPRKSDDTGGAAKNQRWICEPVSSPPQAHTPPNRSRTTSLKKALTGSSLRDLLS